MKFVREQVLDGLQIYTSTVPFPFCVKEEGGKTHVEVYDVDQNHFNILDNMEKGAGYYPLMIADMTIWIYPKQPEGSQKGNECWQGEHL